MLATLIIVFRELIEAGLVVGIILAATRSVAHRGRWVSAGVAGGVFGACIVALFAEAIGNAVQGAGQELFNACVLGLAVLMLGWHNVWMARHGRSIAGEMKEVGAAVSTGQRSLLALTIVVGLAVLREGSEVVLFLYGITLAGGESAQAMLLGGGLGVILGILISALLYLGLLKIPTRHLFSVTSALISLLAAGMAAQGIAFLQQAGMATVLTQTLWDTSGILSDQSLVGKALHTLIGYTDKPNRLQMIAYLVTLASISALMVICKPAKMTKKI
jgi:high-affinity iron transporter